MNQTVNIQPQRSQTGAMDTQNNLEIRNPPRQSKTASKKNYEVIFQGVFILITIISAILINKIYQYQTYAIFETVRKGNIMDLIMYSLPFAVLFVLSDGAVHYMFDKKCQQSYINRQKYTTEQAIEKRSYTLVKWGYSLFYYATTSIIGYYIVKDTTFMPTFLGGDGYCTDVTRYMLSFDEANQAMKVFYILQFGKHAGRFFQHLFIRSEGNFYEYALHHSISTFLIFFSYLMNMWLIGIFVLLIHDISDFFLILARAYRDYKAVDKGTLKVFYVMGGSSWIFCRIFLLSFCCVYSSINSSIQIFMDSQDKYTDALQSVLVFPYFFMAFMLLALETLQIFWTYYIISSFIEVNVSKSVAKHTYD